MQILLAAALPLLMSAAQHSGFTRPQHAFRIECKLTPEGKLRSDIWSDQSTGVWGSHEVVERTVNPEELHSLQLQIQEVAAGPFEHSQNPCDIGGLAILAHLGNTELAILNSLDCGPRTQNLNPSAKKLAAWMRKECKLK